MFKKKKNKANSNPTQPGKPVEQKENVEQVKQKENIEQVKQKENVQQVQQNQNVEQVPTQEVELPAVKESKPVFNAEERLIYEFKPEKDKNPIVVLLVFGFVIGFILCLPLLAKKIDFQRIVKPNVVVEEEPEDQFYYFNKTSVRAKFEGLEFTNFVKVQKDGGYQVNFVINNTQEKAYLFNKKYYIIFYNGDSMVYRALIHSYDAIGSKGALAVKLPITKRAYFHSDRFKLQEIPQAKYTPVELNTSEGEYKTLTCVKENDTMKYYFKEGLLSKINEVYKETMPTKDDEEYPSKKILYEKNLNKYKVLSREYRDKANINSLFIESDTQFEMRNNFELVSIPDEKLRELETYKFFKYNETKEVVSFELEAQGYACS